MTFSFIPATGEDIPALLALAHEASRLPQSHWDETYPNEEILLEDIRLGCLYCICSEEALVGMISLGKAGELTELPWPSGDNNACELSRLALIPALQSKGLGLEVFRQALLFGRELGYTTFRLLVNRDFYRGIRIYEACGFQNTGAAELWGQKFFLYELTAE